MAEANPRPEDRGGDRPSLIQRVRARRRARRMLSLEHGPRRGRGQALLDVLRRLWRRLRGRGGDGVSAAAPTAGYGAAPTAGYGAGQPTAREARRERRDNERFADLGTRMLDLRGTEREAFEDAVLRELMKHKKKDTALWKAFQEGRMPVTAMYANNAYGRELLKADKATDRERLRKDAAPKLPALDLGPAFNQGGEVDQALDAARTRAATDFERGPQPLSRSASTASTVSAVSTRPGTPAVGDPALVSPLSTFATPVSPVSDRAALAFPLGNSASPPSSPSHTRPNTPLGQKPAPARKAKGK
ncbi:hypothetical protein [Streptomyces flavalbus]|uniref:Uncharacterized protein n=1 Tax=Streptomyces flavalbus TaxID=2665155 RepID=A0ABW2WDM7_9ACTN